MFRQLETNATTVIYVKTTIFVYIATSPVSEITIIPTLQRSMAALFANKEIKKWRNSVILPSKEEVVLAVFGSQLLVFVCEDSVISDWSSS